MAPVMHNGLLDAGRLAPSAAAAAPSSSSSSSSSSSANGQPPSGGGLYPGRGGTPLVHVPSPTANYMVAVDAMRGAAPAGATTARSDTEGAPSWAKSHTLRFLVLVACWYACSSLTNNIGKEILQAFTFPVTLTVAQFGFIGVFTYIYATLLWWASDRRGPRVLVSLTRSVARSVVPLALFNIIGHVFSSVAIARVPVSFVHTIKAVSPFFTVLLSTVILGSRYSRDVYISLIPLVTGVIMACTSELAWEFWGGVAALGSALVFVVQNIFSKKIFQDGHLDELNLLFYSSTAAFVFMLPMWFYTEGLELLANPAAQASFDSGVAVLFLANGITHFGQNIFAFTIMTLVSPVTYSIASLFKRVIIIVSAIVYFHTPVTPLNALGLLLTFGGLYLYNNARDSHKASRAATLPTAVPAGGGGLLPTAAPGSAAGLSSGSPNGMYGNTPSPPAPAAPPPPAAAPANRLVASAKAADFFGYRNDSGTLANGYLPRRDSDLMMPYSRA